MSLIQILIFVLMIFIIVFLLYFNASIQRKQNELSRKLIGDTHEAHLSISKNIQENFFQFQNAIFNQIEQSTSHNNFVFEELDKDSKNLTLSIDAQLKEIKEIVDEKLHKTLETRLSHSFQRVSDTLEKVQLGLGEMQVLATGVGDLKRVLSNVKSRGILGEIQLGKILDQLLSEEQFGLNICTIPNTRNHVEFAIKFPGNSSDIPYIWLPIDSKFPMGKYEQLLDAYDSNNKEKIAVHKKALASSVKTMAMDIKSKYIYPPYTTDFGIMFLPTESLYSEVLRIPGLIMEVQSKYKIMLVGPHNLAAFLSSLQQGFKSLAIEKRTDEVWKLLSIIRIEFSKFGDVLDKTQKKILEANNIIESAGAKSRSIERKLNKIDKLEFIE